MSGMSGDGADARCRRSVDMEALVWDLGGGGGGERYHGIQGKDSEGTSAPRRKNVPASKPLPACTCICICNP